MRILLVIFVAQMAAQFAPHLSEAAIVRRVAMIFEQPSETSKQLLVIDEGGHVVVTGSSTTNAEGAWSPVQATEANPVVSGWVHTRAIELEPGDYGYEEHFVHPVGLDIYLSGGTGYLTSNARYFAGKITGGADVLLGPERQWLVGAALTKYISAENVDNPLGGLQRFSSEVSGGYFLISHRLLVRAMVGADYISSNQQYADTRLSALAGAALRWQFPVTKKLWLGIEGCYQYMTTSNSYNDYYYNSSDNGISVQSASVYTWNLVFNYSIF